MVDFKKLADKAKQGVEEGVDKAKQGVEQGVDKAKDAVENRGGKEPGAKGEDAEPDPPRE
jgi:hypothetical protein